MKVDAVVVGAGHAGCEASLALARKGHSVLVSVVDEEYVASMPCNPSIGGPAKGVVVREIDALGGEMAKVADQTALQMKMLNQSKGPGVQCYRAQSDKIEYRHTMREVLRNHPLITIQEGIVVEILHDVDKVTGVRFEDGSVVECDVLILTTGTYLSSKIMVGDHVTENGPEGLPTTFNLGDSIRSLGLNTFRLKTGTPPRVITETIDFTGLEPQPGNIEEGGFSDVGGFKMPIESQALCYLTYTNEKTHEIIRTNLHRSSMYSGVVKGVGPRYCPSIEDKLVRFSDKPRHQLFLEPESKSLNTTYLQGFSTSLPYDVQDEMVHTLKGLENCKIDKWAYAIEYDAIDPRQLKSTLAYKGMKGLYCAGQINGTSGYEEAAGQGLMAGINAANELDGKPSLVLGRDEAYIGVMIDDLVTKGTKEPYRLFTSRAEYRLLIRHDNADQRLIEYGYREGLISEERMGIYQEKMRKIKELKETLESHRVHPSEEVNTYFMSKGYEEVKSVESAETLLKRPNISVLDLCQVESIPVEKEIAKQVEIEIKYKGYIAKEKREAESMKKWEKIKLPSDFDYEKMERLSLEARQKLNAVRPENIAQASRIEGIAPADLQVLSLELKERRKKS